MTSCANGTESAKINRLDFDRVIKTVLGISGEQLYDEWKNHLLKKYRQKVTDIGTQVYGRKINKDGFINLWPRFSPDGSRIYFLSNGKNDYSRKHLYSYALSDTVDEKQKIRLEMGIGNVYDIHAPTGKICFSVHTSRQLPARYGWIKGTGSFHRYSSSRKKKIRLFHKTDKQLAKKVCSVHHFTFRRQNSLYAPIDRPFFLSITDTSGNLDKRSFRRSQTASRSDIFSV